jgi:NAD+ diphosphatase
MLDVWYTRSPLDRVSNRREDTGWIEAVRRAEATCIVPVWRSENLMQAEAARALMPTLSQAGDLLEIGRFPSVLGVRDDIAYIAVDLSHIEDPYDHPFIGEHGAFEDLRKVGSMLAREEGAILAHARGLMTWHLRHGFCGVCGSPTESSHAGHQRNCPNCKASHFPRTDPAVIMLVVKDDMCLLGRTHNFRPGMYSTLAGFVEPGESLEEAVAREVYEETGIRVREARYLGSQPWPFPSSLMLGFHAVAETSEIHIDPKELEDARWVHRFQLENPRELGITLPRPDSIASKLIQAWMNGT